MNYVVQAKTIAWECIVYVMGDLIKYSSTCAMGLNKEALCSYSRSLNLEYLLNCKCL